MHAELLAPGLAGPLVDIGRSVRESFYMFWDTLWALLLGFGLSGVVQAFVSRRAMQRQLGDHRPASVVRASLYGMVSSSCSYAASAMARSLIVKGADFLAAIVFMFASTNLVIELGIVLVVLIGWQFVAAEFVGGVIMIALLVALGSLWLRGRVVVDARETARSRSGGHEHDEEAEAALEREGWRSRIRSAGGWADAASYTMSDLTMLRKEIGIGFLVAGFLSVLVPGHLWADVFVRGHGFWTNLENVVIGPFVAVISFVCSVGNVPLAAALWRGGISFGGVVAFIFADLIAMPLLLIYRKQYGGRIAIRLLGLYWLVMSATGLVIEYLFRAAGWVPTARPGVVVGDTVRLNLTTFLDIAAVVAFALLYWLSRNRERLGGGSGYAKDPVCGMQVEIAHAPASTLHEGARVYFCSEHCRDRFEVEPGRFVRDGAATDREGQGSHEGATDPVCGMTVDPRHAPASTEHGGRTFYFCNAGCRDHFVADPERFLRDVPGDEPRRHPFPSSSSPA